MAGGLFNRIRNIILLTLGGQGANLKSGGGPPGKLERREVDFTFDGRPSQFTRAHDHQQAIRLGRMANCGFRLKEVASAGGGKLMERRRMP